MRPKISVKTFAIALLALAAGLGVALHNRLSEPPKTPSSSELWNRPLSQPGTDNTASLAEMARTEKKAVLVNFWASWCPPCVHEMPLLEEASQTLTSAKIVGIGIEEPEEITAFIAQNPVTYDILRLNDDFYQFFIENGNPSAAMPFTVLYNREGNIIRHKLGDFRSVEEIVSFVENGKVDGKEIGRNGHGNH